MSSYKLVAYRKANGLCIECGEQNDLAPKILCSTCAVIQKHRTEKCNRQVKVDTFNAYGGCKCACCSEDNLVMLTIDHIGGGGAAHRRQIRGDSSPSGGGGNKMYHWLKRHKYPPGYRVLCFNCNHAIHVQGNCPHKTDVKVNILEIAKTFALLQAKAVPSNQIN